MSTLDNIIGERKNKINQIREAGLNPYPEKCQRSFIIGEALNEFDSLSQAQKKIYLVGRIMALRQHGGLIFVDIADESGRIQLLLKKDKLGNNQFVFFLEKIDIGDFIQVQGDLFKTNAGEITLRVLDYILISKALRPLPSEWYGLTDDEERFRRRYLDLLMNEGVKKRLDLRLDIIRLIRTFLYDDGYKEVETPILQTLFGGAAAQPFTTHLNALDMDLYLRIAPELYLKRLIVGGYEKVFELGKNFRNEGMDREHNPEFTMLELYAAYRDRDYLFGLIEDMMTYLFKNLSEKIALTGSKFTYQDKVIDIKRPFARISFGEIIKKETGLDIDTSKLADFQKKARELDVEFGPGEDKAKIADSIFKKFRSKIINPTFLIDHPTDISPLAKKNATDPSKTLRLQFFMAGWELMNGFAELNDPQDQEERFESQTAKRKAGDKESHPMDKDFIEALEYGMPPTAGLGIGIDRIVPILTNDPSLKETIFFPLMRPNN